MPLSWYDVLLELNAAPQRRLRMLELGEAVVLSRTRVSRIVDELVAAGYVTKVPNPEDGRSAFTELTATGRAAFRKAAPVYLGRIRAELGAHVTAHDACGAARHLARRILRAQSRFLAAALSTRHGQSAGSTVETFGHHERASGEGVPQTLADR